MSICQLSVSKWFGTLFAYMVASNQLNFITMSKNDNSNTTINYEDLEQYTPCVGKCFNVYFETEDRTLSVEPYYWEDDYTIEPDIIGGYNVYENGEFLGSCEDIDEIENLLYNDNSNRFDANYGAASGDSCYWHGEDGHIIYIDDDEATILVGDFTDEEVNDIITKYENDEDLGEIDERIVWATREEFDEQQEF